jgi:ribonucleoside-triphosphate reductase (thioredoxin)
LKLPPDSTNYKLPSPSAPQSSEHKILTEAVSRTLPTAVDTPWSSVGYLTYKRTYSRRLDENDTSSATEEWRDTVQRVVSAANEQLHCGFTDDEQRRLESYLQGLKGSVAGRFLWQLGTTTVGKLGLASLQNCAFTTVDSPRAFTWAFDLLMLGSGVGYNIQREYVSALPRVSSTFKPPVRDDTSSADFIVPDTREGWVQLLDYLLASAFEPHASKRQGFRYSCQLVRSKGAPIRGFGGVASGPEDLVWGIGEIAGILEARAGQQLRPIDCLDIMNIIGAVVVAGNVRRSAQIAIGDYDDEEYMQAKRWDLGAIPSWRSKSNNSVVCSDIRLLPDSFWEGYKGNGEPYGIINLDLSRAIGRTGDTRYPDANVRGYNPCAEQSLEDYETCCLAEIFLPNIDTKAELLDVAELLYRVCKHSLALPCHLPETANVVHKNMRMGIGITGYLQASEEQRSWLSETYERLREYDKVYSAERGFSESIKLTTVKPSGTLSLLPGVTPGCHPAFSNYLIRRIRVASDSPLVAVCRAHGYDVEFQRNFDGTNDTSTVVVSFPFSYPEGTKLAADMTAIDQLEVVKRLQTEWSDNSVSCTVYYRLEELPLIQEYLKENYTHNFKSLSFLLHSGHGFDQAPLEEIDKATYLDMLARSTMITSVATASYESDDECAGGVCPVK